MQVLLFVSFLALTHQVLSRRTDINTILVDLQINGAEKQIYHYEKTLAEVYVKKSNPLDIVVCSLWQTQSNEEKRDVLQKLDRNVVITKLKLQDMLDIIEKCNNHLSAQKILQDDTVMDVPLEDKDSLVMLKRGLKNTRKGIAPGTLWCGVGNDAGSFSQLGPAYQIDRCCRQHDLCPMEIKAFTQSNPTPYTLSLCECDAIFYNCLKSLKSPSAERLGNLFFNGFDIDCIELMKNPRDDSVVKVIVPSKLRF